MANQNPLMEEASELVMRAVTRGHKFMFYGTHVCFYWCALYDGRRTRVPDINPELILGLIKLISNEAEKSGTLGQFVFKKNDFGHYCEFRPRQTDRETLIKEATDAIQGVQELLDSDQIVIMTW